MRRHSANFRYRAASWGTSRRVVAKVEWLGPPAGASSFGQNAAEQLEWQSRPSLKWEAGGIEMFKILKLVLVVGIAMTGAAAPASSQYQQPSQYGQPWPNYPNQGNGGYIQNGQRYTTVTVTNRGQNGYPDQVVQQQVLCGSQYYDGYRQRIAQC